MADDDGCLKMIGSYAYSRCKHLANEFKPGEGLVGQAALEKKSILLTNCPVEYISIHSGLGEAAPNTILVFPLLINAMEEKGLALNISMADDLPELIRTDEQRLEQIIKNLMSNAIKFTDEGSISVAFFRPPSDTELSRSGLDAQYALAIAVTDTGIGIPPDKQLEIFEAFQQADGCTSRKYGGTGLGLSISRERAKLLGGEIHLQSKPGKGATFTIYLPSETQNSKLESRIPERSRRTQSQTPTSHISHPLRFRRPRRSATRRSRHPGDCR